MDLGKRKKDLSIEANKLLESKDKALDIVNKCNSRLLEIQGALKEIDIFEKQQEENNKDNKDVEPKK